MLDSFNPKTNPSMLNHFENDYAEYRLKDSVMYITYKENVRIDLKAGIQIVKDRLLLHKDEFLPVLCDIRGIKEINKPARDYLANEGSALIKAVAFIVEAPLSEKLSKFYLRTSKPPIPTGLFEETSEAMIYLSKFMRKTKNPKTINEG